jgi:hypothetical protein
MQANPAAPEPSKAARTQAPDLSDYPVREYVRAMSIELAQMALWDGDPQLCKALEAAAEMASKPVSVAPLRDSEPVKRAD